MNSWFDTPAGKASGIALCVALLAGYWFYQVAPLMDDYGTGVTGIVSHQNDFKHLYIGAMLLSRELSPYDAANVLTMTSSLAETDPRFGTPDELRIQPYVYLPFTGFVLTPLTSLPFWKAAALFQVINHLCILAALVITAGALGWLRKPWPMAALLLLVAFNFTVFRQNNAGQLNAILLLGFALLFLGIVRRWHDSVIGAIAAFLMLFKLSPGIFLIWFLLRREWARAAWMAAFALALTAVTVCLYGLQRHLEFLPVLEQMRYGRSTWSEFGRFFWRDPYNQSFNALFHRLFVEYPGVDIRPWMSLPQVVANGLTWIASLAVLGLFAMHTWKKSAPLEAEFSLAICTSLLIPSILWDHYLVQLAVPMALLLALGWNSNRRTISLALLAVALIVISMIVTLDQPAFRQGPALLLMSVKLVPVLICFALSLMLCGGGVAERSPSPLTSQPVSGVVDAT